MAKSKVTKASRGSATAPKGKGKLPKRSSGADGPHFREVPSGSSMGVYSTTNQQGQQIGWYVVVGNKNVTIQGFTWLANQAYWFWWTSPFPDAFALAPAGSTPPTGLNPAYASPVTTAGPFNTTGRVPPATLTRWWLLAISGTGPVGAMGSSNGVVQYWYENQANTYLPLNPGELLMFTPTTQPTNPMYQAIDVVI